MKKYIPIICILALLLLPGCRSGPDGEEPSAPATSSALTETVPPVTCGPGETTDLREFYLDVRDGVHCFWVEAGYSGEPREDYPESDMGLTLSFYERNGDSRPVQVIETGTMMWNERFRLVTVDADFDGYTDFYYTYSEGLHDNGFRCFFIWDPETGTYIRDPYGLNGLMNAAIDGENRAVVEYERGTDYERERYYRYTFLEKELYPCRELYYGGWDGKTVMTVTEYEYGGEGQTVVFAAESPEAFSGPEYEEFCRWRDLDYHGKQEVRVDDTRTLWVEWVDGGEFGSFDINIYREKTDTQPVQTLEGSCETGFQYLYVSVQDMDFDGYGDLAVLYSEAPNGHAAFSYYIWDEKEERFIPDPYGLNGLFSVGLPEVWPEEKTVKTFLRWGAGREGEIRHYRYREEGLACVRQMFWCWHEDGSVTFLVVDDENGEMQTVYEETCLAEELGEYLWSEGFGKWNDPAYHGEE